MNRAVADPDTPIAYSESFREYGLEYQDGGTSVLGIRFCPWCGAHLPESLRDRWLQEIGELGFEPGDPQIPPSFASDRWWRH